MRMAAQGQHPRPLAENPLSLLAAFAASSPKGTPLGCAGNFIATAKSRPLGEGGIAVGDDGRGIPGKHTLHFSRKLYRYAKGSPFGRAGIEQGEMTERASPLK